MTASSCNLFDVATNGMRVHRFQDALAMLASTDDPIPYLLELFCKEQPATPQTRSWRRIFGRFDPDGQPYCRMVYESSGGHSILLVVDLHLLRPDGVGKAYFDKVVGWACVTNMESDAKLITLPQVIASAAQVQVVRYRPGMRCTLRVQDPITERVRFAKVFPDDAGEYIHHSGIALWQAAERGELGFQVAPPDQWDTATRAVWQGCVPGTPIMEELASDSGASMAWQVGRACGSLSLSKVCASMEFTSRHQLEATVRNIQTLVRYLPGAGKMLETFLDDLTRVHRQQPVHALRPIHGAPHAHQWLAVGQKLGLVDFDRFCMGEPELDAATFVAEMDFERSTRVPIAQLNQAFLDAYESRGVVLRLPVLQAYRAHKRLAKALRSARAIRPDGMQRSLLHLARAQEALYGETAPDAHGKTQE
jgi:hypothetical protein